MTISENTHIAIIQTAFIGDVVLSLPIAQSIKNTNPNCKITFITNSQSVKLVETSKAVDSVIEFDKRNKHKKIKDLLLFVSELNKQKFDIVISLHRSFRTSFLVSRLKNCKKIGFKNSSINFIYDYRAKYIKNYHEIERNYELLNFFDKIRKIDLFKVQTQFLQKDIEQVNSLLKENNINKEKIIIIAPGSVWATKRWTKEYYPELINNLTNLDYSVLLIGSEKDFELCKYISRNTKAINLSSKTSIPQSLYLIKISKLIITNDSSPTHFSGLFNIPTITIFGPTSPIFGFSPRSQKSIIIRDENLKCSPCRIHGSDICPLGTHNCMKNISPQTVFDNSIKLLNLS